MPTSPAAKNPDFASGLAAVTMRAAFDRRFRASLLDDPHRAIRESFGIELPSTLRLRFLEKPGDLDLLVVLPDVVDDSPLAADALERIAGGAGRGVCFLPGPSGAVTVPV